MTSGQVDPAAVERGNAFPAGPTGLGEIAAFFAIAYGFSWLCFLPLVLRGDGPYAFIMVGSFGPTIAAITCSRIYGGTYRAVRVIGSPYRTVLCATMGVGIIVLAYVVLPVLVATGTAALNWTAALSPNMLRYSTFLGGPLGEEPGWRGYALTRMQTRWGPLRSTVLLGILWAGWHLPLFFVNEWTTSPFWLYLFLVLGLSVVFTFTTNFARFAVLPAILMHAVFNRVSAYLSDLLAGVHMRTEVRFDLIMAICGFAAACLLALATKGHLGQGRPQRPYYADSSHAGNPGS